MYGAILVSPEQPVQCMYGQPIRQSRNTTVLTVTTSVELRPRATRWAISLDFTKQKFLRHHATKSHESLQQRLDRLLRTPALGTWSHKYIYATRIKTNATYASQAAHLKIS